MDIYVNRKKKIGNKWNLWCRLWFGHHLSVVKSTKQNGVSDICGKAGFWRLFGGVAKSQKMRTQICEAVKSWLLKILVWRSGEWWRNVGYGGGFDG